MVTFFCDWWLLHGAVVAVHVPVAAAPAELTGLLVKGHRIKKCSHWLPVSQAKL